LRVSVLENAERPLKRQLDPEASRLLLEIAAERGVEIITGAETLEIEGGAHVEGLRLKDGRRLKAQLVVISAGVRANTAVLAAAGGKVARAAVIDAHCRTNLPHVYACGDCAEFEGVNFSIWPEAARQGEVAGANAAGEALAYENLRPGLSLFTLDTALYAYGDTGADPNRQYDIRRETDAARRSMRTRIYAGGRLVGAILIGDLQGMEALENEIKGLA
ncbi:MAG: FAD-dependent oxidoreductase, partial [Clostridia bacterium]|nr:FAD-dependent oxidoreductase [Clostridia bacterium]